MTIVCPVCQNVNPPAAVTCLRCTVDLAFVTARIEMTPADPPTDAAAEPTVEADSGTGEPEISCPHCGASRLPVGATRCLWCKKPLAGAPPVDERYVVASAEPESSVLATACGGAVFAFASILIALNVVALFGGFASDRRGGSTVGAMFQTMILLAIARSGIRFVQQEKDSRKHFGQTLVIMGVWGVLNLVVGTNARHPGVLLLGLIMSLLTAIVAIVFLIDGRRGSKQ